MTYGPPSGISKCGELFKIFLWPEVVPDRPEELEHSDFLFLDHLHSPHFSLSIESVPILPLTLGDPHLCTQGVNRLFLHRALGVTKEAQGHCCFPLPSLSSLGYYWKFPAASLGKQIPPAALDGSGALALFPTWPPLPAFPWRTPPMSQSCSMGTYVGGGTQALLTAVEGVTRSGFYLLYTRRTGWVLERPQWVTVVRLLGVWLMGEHWRAPQTPGSHRQWPWVAALSGDSHKAPSNRTWVFPPEPGGL